MTTKLCLLALSLGLTSCASMEKWDRLASAQMAAEQTAQAQPKIALLNRCM